MDSGVYRNALFSGEIPRKPFSKNTVHWFMKLPMLSVLAVLTALLVAPSPAFSQAQFHVFPQFADGRASDGTYYRSTITILPWSGAASAPNCTFVLYGMTATFDTGASGYYFTAYVPPGTMLSAPTSGTQALQTGYATLNCTDYVYAHVLYTYYAQDSHKLGEATVFSSPESALSRMAFDVRGGVRQAFAIANNTDFNRSYLVSLGSGGVTRSARVVVPARRNLARFADELLSVVPESIGILTIQSDDLSSFSTTGFRYTGGVFTTIPPGN